MTIEERDAIKRKIVYSLSDRITNALESYDGMELAFMIGRSVGIAESEINNFPISEVEKIRMYPEG